MKKTILTIQGSPRLQGNTNNVLTLLESKLTQTYNINRINLQTKHINYCLGCNKCQQTSAYKCVQQDDMNDLLSNLIEADVIIYATPLYGHNYSAQLKTFLDRHVPLMKFEENDQSVTNMQIHSALQNKPVALLVTCQGPIEDNTELIQQLFEKYTQSTLTKNLGTYIFPFTQDNTNQTQIDLNTIDTLVSKLR